MGVLRVTEGFGTSGPGTQGLKLWTFGVQGLDVDLNDSAEWLRPTIEMWHGVTPEFWDRGAMAAGEVRTWRDHYFPTVGLREVTASSEFGAVFLSRAGSGAEPALSAVASLTIPGRSVRVILSVDGTNIFDESVVVPESGSLAFDVSGGASADAPAGATFSAEFIEGETRLLQAEIVLP